MTDETRPDEGTDPLDAPQEPEQDVEALPARDGDEDPDTLAGDFTDPDVEVDLPVIEDEDGGDQ